VRWVSADKQGIGLLIELLAGFLSGPRHDDWVQGPRLARAGSISVCGGVVREMPT
jgi:hypothetical protein